MKNLVILLLCFSCLFGDQDEDLKYPSYAWTYPDPRFENIVQSGSNMLAIGKTHQCGDGVYSYEKCDVIFKLGEVGNSKRYNLRTVRDPIKCGKFCYVRWYVNANGETEDCLLQTHGRDEGLEKKLEKKLHNYFIVEKVDAYCSKDDVPEYKRCPSNAPYYNSATDECTNICDSIPNYQNRIHCYCKEKGLSEPNDVKANVEFDENGNYKEGCLLTCRGDVKSPLKLDYAQCTTDDNLNAPDKNDYGVKPGENDGNSNGESNGGDTKPNKPDENNPKPNNPNENTPQPNNPNENNSNNEGPKKPDSNNNSSGNSSNNNSSDSHSAELGNGEGGTNSGNSNNSSGSANKGKDHNGSKIIPPNNPKDNGECKGLECGKPDKLPGEDIKKGTEKMFSSFEGFKNNLIDKTDSLKNDLNDLKNKIITNKFQNLTNYEVTHCPYKANFTTPYFSIPLNFDVCMVVSILYPVIYFLTFISVLYLGIKFFLRILMRL